jgi:hypothetical protein
MGIGAEIVDAASSRTASTTSTRRRCASTGLDVPMPYAA